jgi:mannosyltransferase
LIALDGIIYSLQVSGGISVYFNELIRNIPRNIPHKVLLFGPKAVERSGLDMENANYHINRSRKYERYRRCNISNQIKLFHSSYYRLPSLSVPVVTTVFDFTYERYIKGPRRWVHSWQKFKAIRNSDAIICISHSTRRDLLEYLPEISPEIVHVVHMGVNKVFTPLDQVSGSAFPSFVLFVGARSGYKNFKLAVKAVAVVPDLVLVCVGGGQLTRDEITLLNKLIPGRWNHNGYVSDEELNRLYNRATCLIYPSANEGFGMPVLEAMRAGCPVVALNASSIPEIAGEAALLLQSENHLALSDLLRQTLEKPEQQRLRKLGIIQSSKFSWAKTFNNTFQIYDQVLGQTIIF